MLSRILEQVKKYQLHNADVLICSNPTYEEFKNFVKRYNFIRGMMQGDDVYWADGNTYLHYKIADMVGVPYSYEGRIEAMYDGGVFGTIKVIASDPQEVTQNKAMYRLMIKRNNIKLLRSGQDFAPLSKFVQQSA
jgi:hypothetical protein